MQTQDYKLKTIDMYEIRKSIGGWSIDKKIGNTWIFIAKYSSKRKCIDYINNQTKSKQTTTQTVLF